jgi:hypothetical protein
MNLLARQFYSFYNLARERSVVDKLYKPVISVKWKERTGLGWIGKNEKVPVAMLQSGSRRPPLPKLINEYEFQDLVSLIARGQERQTGKRAVSFPNRIRLYVLSRSNFDEEDTQWLCTTISTFLVIIEKSVPAYEYTKHFGKEIQCLLLNRN